MNIFQRQWWADRRERKLIKAYVALGLSCGDALSYGYIGTPEGIDEDMVKLTGLEHEYVGYGYEPLSIDQWVTFGGGYQEMVVEVLRVPRWSNLYPVSGWVSRRNQGAVKFGDVGHQLMVEGKDFVEGTHDPTGGEQ